MTTVSLTLNGKQVSADVPDNTLLVNFIRETMSLTGTHVGCDTSQCGACVVHVDGESVKSCTMLAANHGMIASFSRALSEGLTAQMSEEEFTATLDAAIAEIYAASIT